MSLRVAELPPEQGAFGRVAGPAFEQAFEQAFEMGLGEPQAVVEAVVVQGMPAGGVGFLCVRPLVREKIVAADLPGARAVPRNREPGVPAQVGTRVVQASLELRVESAWVVLLVPQKASELAPAHGSPSKTHMFVKQKFL